MQAEHAASYRASVDRERDVPNLPETALDAAVARGA